MTSPDVPQAGRAHPAEPVSARSGPKPAPRRHLPRLILALLALPLLSAPASAAPRPHACPDGLAPTNATLLPDLQQRRYQAAAVAAGLPVGFGALDTQTSTVYCVTARAAYLNPNAVDPNYTGPPTRNPALAVYLYLAALRQIYYGRPPPASGAPPPLDPDRLTGCGLARAGVPRGADLVWLADELLRLTPGNGSDPIGCISRCDSRSNL